MVVSKAHAFGNDFLLVPEADVPLGDRGAVARALCHRHHGVGADGLILYRVDPDGVAGMRLLNADGSRSEISGNGVRCLAAWLAHQDRLTGAERRGFVVRTDAGEKRLELLERDGARVTFRAAMGQPEQVAQRTLTVDGAPVDVVTLRVGNPQCVLLGSATEDRLARYGRALATHPAFPDGTNVELAEIEAPDRVRILIWERGVGPTLASGTGACAAAVAAAAVGGASRDVQVAAPGGTQRVEWREDGLYLTGWAEVVLEGRWIATGGGAPGT